MDAEHIDEGSALRPARRTDKLIVREVGDELVAYALDTEQVTALDAQTAQVFKASDGASSVAQIAARVGLDESTVSSELDRLSRGGLISSGWVSRRTLIGAAVATPLLSIVAAQAAFASSIASVTWATKTCAKVTGNYNFSGTATISNATSGTSYLWELYEMPNAGATTGGTLKATSTVTANANSYTFPVTAPGFSDAVHYLRLRVYNGNTNAFTFLEAANVALTPGNGQNCSVV